MIRAVVLPKRDWCARFFSCSLSFTDSVYSVLCPSAKDDDDSFSIHSHVWLLYCSMAYFLNDGINIETNQQRGRHLRLNIYTTHYTPYRTSRFVCVYRFCFFFVIFMKAMCTNRAKCDSVLSIFRWFIALDVWRVRAWYLLPFSFVAISHFFFGLDWIVNWIELCVTRSNSLENFIAQKESESEKWNQFVAEEKG